MDQGYSCIGRSLSISAARFPDKPAIVEIDRFSLTYRQLNEGANRLANMMVSRGMGRGDHVAVLSENSLEHVLVLYAAAKFGGVPVVLDPKWTPTEVARAVDFFDCRILVVDDVLSDKITATDLANVRHGVITYSSPRARCELLDVVRDSSAAETGIAVLDHDTYSLMLTSGTTGLPKGCVRTHRNVEMGCMNGAMAKPLDTTSKELVVVPIYYGSGRGSIIGQVYVGGTVYLMSKFDPARFADVVAREQITLTGLAPTMASRLLNLPKLDTSDFRSLQALRKAGSPFNPAMAADLMAKVTPNLYGGYASTESGGVTILRPADHVTKPGSSGLPCWGVDIEIVDDSGTRLPRGAEGEVRVSGPNVCQGYYNNPEEEAKVFHDGWYHTGDLGKFDDDGHLYIVGRIKDVIKTGSINVAPREVENTIIAMESVEDVAVVGVPDPEWGEAVKAFVVSKPGCSVTADHIVRHCKQTLASYKVPKKIEFTDRIERNALGKVTAEFKARVKIETHH